MSHEIRTPLNGILGFTQLLLTHQDISAEQHEYLVGITNCSEALLTIINDVLDLAKIDAGRMDLHPQPFFLLDCIDRSIDVVASIARKKSISVGFSVQPNVPHALYGDIGRLTQVLINLMNNAIKFSSARGKVEITVSSRVGETYLSEEARSSTSSVRGADDAVRLPVVGEFGEFVIQISVADSGIGIRDGTGLFEPFTQEDNSNTRRFDGTGLGLAICRRIVALMNGRIWFESAPGKGATFHIEVPMLGARPAGVTKDRRSRSLGAGTIIGLSQNKLTFETLLSSLRLIKDGLANPLDPASTDSFDLTYHIAGSMEDLKEMISVSMRHGESIKAILIDTESFEAINDDFATLAKECLAMRSALQNASIPLLGVCCSSQSSRSLTQRTGVECALLRPLRHGAFQEKVHRALGLQMKPTAPQGFLAILDVPSGADFAPTQPPPDEETESAPEKPAVSHSGVRVLLTEDNIVNQRVVLALLDRLGVTADIAVNGLEAISAVERNPYDIVLMDVQMPVMSGIEAATKIRELNLTPAPVIIALTAATTSQDRIRCLEVMDDYLSKPISLKGLRATINKCLIASGRASLPVIAAPAPRSVVAPKLEPAANANLLEQVQGRNAVPHSGQWQLIFWQSWAVAVTAVALFLWFQK
jgi:two-component system, sensor histidine kinase and response regulator